MSSVLLRGCRSLFPTNSTTTTTRAATVSTTPFPTSRPTSSSPPPPLTALEASSSPSYHETTPCVSKSLPSSLTLPNRQSTRASSLFGEHTYSHAHSPECTLYLRRFHQKRSDTSSSHTELPKRFRLRSSKRTSNSFVYSARFLPPTSNQYQSRPLVTQTSAMERNGEIRAKRKQSPVPTSDRPAKHLKPETSLDPGDTTPANGTVYNIEGSVDENEPVVSVGPAQADSPEWQATIESVVKSVVSIHFCQTCSFDTELSMSSQATGFVVDAKNGYILTNRHVVCAGPFSGYCIFDNHEEVSLRPSNRIKGYCN